MARMDSLISRVDALIAAIEADRGSRTAAEASRTTAAAEATRAASEATARRNAELDERKRRELADRTRELQQTLNDIQTATTEVEAKITNMGFARILQYEEYSKLQQKQLQLKEKEAEQELAIQKIELERARLASDSAAETAALNQILAKEQALRNATKALEDFLKKAERLKPALELGAEAGQKLASSIGLGNNEFTSLFKKVESFKGSFGEFTGEMGKGFIASVLDPSKIAGAVINSSYELMRTTNQLFADTKKGYGVEYGEKLNSVFTRTERSLRTYGISAQDATKINMALNDTFSDFLDMSEAEQKSLIKNTGVMQKAGVANEEYSQSIRFMEYSMGESREASQENTAELVEFGRKNGIQAKQTIANFTKVRSYVSQFGDNWQKTFNRVSMISRKTGVDIQGLVSISQGFDTFESAATSVGKLNALLGGPFLNTVDMIRTEDPAEQIMKIKNAFDSAGKSVNSMSKFELKGFAESIPGINGDIEKMRTLLNKLDSGMITSADALTEALEGPNKQQKALEDQLLASQSIAESLEIISKSIAVFTPLLEMINPLISTFATTVSYMGSALGMLVGDFAKLGAFVKFAEEITEAGTKTVPVLGTLLSIISALVRLMNGDFVGFGLELAAGAAGFFFPGAGGIIGQAGLGMYDSYRGYENYTAEKSGVDDFIYRGNGVNGSITPINSKDQFLGLKDGGPAQAGLKDIMDGMSRDKVSYETSNSIQNKTENDFARTNINNTNANNGTPNINLTVMLEGRELRAFVKQVIADNLNPLK